MNPCSDRNRDTPDSGNDIELAGFGGGPSSYFWKAESPDAFRWKDGRIVLNPESKSGLAPHVLKDACLFARFADTDPTPETILKLAHDHGALFSDDPSGETLEDWRSELVALARAVLLWRAWRGDVDVGALLPRMVRREIVRGKPVWTCTLASRPEILLRERLPSAQVKGRKSSAITSSDVFDPDAELTYRVFLGRARHAAILEDLDAIGDESERTRAAALSCLCGIVNHAVGRFPQRTRFLMEKASDGRLLPYRAPVPACLAQALWLQLADAIEGRALVRKCPGCGKWFDLSENRKARSWTACLKCRNKLAKRKQRMDEEYRLRENTGRQKPEGDYERQGRPRKCGASRA